MGRLILSTSSDRQVIEAGANALVAGSAVFGSKDYAEAIAGIKASKAPAKEPVMA